MRAIRFYLRLSDEMTRERKPKVPALERADAGTLSPRLARAVRLASALPAPPSPPRPRGRPRRTEAREKLTVYVSPALALRLRWHCDYTGQELSGFVERAVAAVLDAAADNGTRKIT